MIRRDLETVLRSAARQYPVVTLTGPRQAGKTTLCRAVFDGHAYVSLEAIDTRQYATEDPRGFLQEYGDGAVLDEVLHAPQLLSYLQTEVDGNPAPGRFILTGSQHLGLLAGVSQSLAGRTAVLHLFPPTLNELRRFGEPLEDLMTVLWTGAYPAIHDRGIPPTRWLTDYVTTYVQRDVRQILNVGDLEAFTTFVRLCAGRTATEVNLSSLGSDAGVTHNTARAWLSVLETGFLCFRAPAWRRSARKQLIKASKLHFIDSGLVCRLLGIEAPDQLRHHPLRGPVFESWVASEIYRSRAHRGLEPRIFHYRDAKGLEVDVVCERAGRVAAVEAKSAQTVVPDFLRPLKRFEEASEAPVDAYLVFGGRTAHRRSGVRVLPWDELHSVNWAGDFSPPPAL